MLSAQKVSTPSNPKEKTHPINGFIKKQQAFGHCYTGHAYLEKLTNKTFIFKNTKVRFYSGKLEGSDTHNLGRAYLGMFGPDNVFINQRLSKREIALEKLAYDFYRLYGVNVPDSKIVSSPFQEANNAGNTYNFKIRGGATLSCFNSGKTVTVDDYELTIYNLIEKTTDTETLHLASEKLPKYQTLDELLHITENVANKANNKKRFEAIAAQKINGKPIKDFFESLPVMAFLYDWDGLGKGMSNFGFIDRGDHYQFVKIDPGEACLLNKPNGKKIDEHGFIDLKNSGGTILKEFQIDNDDPWNFQKVFKAATYEQKLEGIRRLTSVTDKQIEHTVNNTDGAKYIPEDEKAAIISEQIRRKNIFLQTYEKDLQASRCKEFIDACNEVKKLVKTFCEEIKLDIVPKNKLFKKKTDLGKVKDTLDKLHLTIPKLVKFFDPMSKNDKESMSDQLTALKFTFLRAKVLTLNYQGQISLEWVNELDLMKNTVENLENLGSNTMKKRIS